MRRCWGVAACWHTQAACKLEEVRATAERQRREVERLRRKLNELLVGSSSQLQRHDAVARLEP